MPGNTAGIGRYPSVHYTPEITGVILARLSLGEPLSSICKGKDMPSSRVVNDWVANYPDFAESYQEARDRGFDEIAKDTMKIADDVTADRDQIAKAALRIKTRHHLLGCWDPKRYGPRVQQDHTGNFNVTIGAAESKL